MVFNPVTDQLKLVQEVLNEQGVLLENVFGKAPRVFSGYFQDIYRNGQFVGTVPPLERLPEDQPYRSQLRLYKGDNIYRIPATSIPYSFQGTLTTREHYQRIYDVEVELEVQNRQSLIKEYQKSHDPARWAIYHYKQHFEAEALQHEYDRLSEIKSSLAAKSEQLNTTFGIKILNPRWNIKDDPQRLQDDEIYLEQERKKRSLRDEADQKESLLQLEQRNEITRLRLQLDTLKHQTELRRKEMELEAELKDFEARAKRESEEFKRNEILRKNAFGREEQMRTAQHEVRMKLLNHTLEVLVASNAERIRDVLECNGSARAILEDALKLLDVFEAPPQETKEIVEAAFSEEDESLQTGKETS